MTDPQVTDPQVTHHLKQPLIVRTEAPPIGYKLKRQYAIKKALKAPKRKRLSALLLIVRREIEDVDANFKPFNSAHEAYGVVLEEQHELWDEIRKHQSKRDYEAMTKEAVQLAAMAIRLIQDVCCDATRGHEMISAIADPLRLSENVIKQMRDRVESRQKKPLKKTNWPKMLRAMKASRKQSENALKSLMRTARGASRVKRVRS